MPTESTSGETTPPAPPQSPPGQPASHEQSRLPPHILVWLSVLAGAIMLLSYLAFAWMAYQGWESLGRQFERAPQETRAIIGQMLKQAGDRSSLNEAARVALEFDALTYRQGHVASAIALRGFMRFNSLMIGSVIALVGAALVLARISSDRAPDNATASGGGLVLSLTSVYPGVIMVGLGCALVALPNLASQPVDWKDKNIYLDPRTGQTSASGPTADAAMRERLKDIYVKENQK